MKFLSFGEIFLNHNRGLCMIYPTKLEIETDVSLQLVSKQSILQCKELLASKLQIFEPKTRALAAVTLSGYRIFRWIYFFPKIVS